MFLSRVGIFARLTFLYNHNCNLRHLPMAMLVVLYELDVDMRVCISCPEIQRATSAASTTPQSPNYHYEDTTT